MKITEAQTIYLDSLQASYLSPLTIRLYRTRLSQLAAWAEAKKLALEQITKLHLQRFMASRKISQNTAHAETQFYKTFFAWCEEAGLVSVSPARALKPPRYVISDKKAYTQDEIIRIFAAIEELKAGFYIKQRARAALCVLRYHAPRISDVVLLRRDAICPDGFLRLVTHKNKKSICHPLVPAVVEALNRLPVPIGTRGESKYFFWNERETWDCAVKNLRKTLDCVYKLSGVAGAHNHRFRHTAASRLLAQEKASARVAADFLGDSTATIEKYYAKFIPERQQRVNEAMAQLLRQPDSPMSTGYPIEHNFHSPADLSWLGLFAGVTSWTI